MTMLQRIDPVLEKFQIHLRELGLNSRIVDDKLDFECDFNDSYVLGNGDGIGTVGSLKLMDSPIDYVQLIKKQKIEKCDYAVGGFAGMGVHTHSWWRIRFLLSFPSFVEIGPFDMGTITTIKKKFFQSEVEDFIWSGYVKLTTLPPGMIRDDVSAALQSDKMLNKLMMQCLLKERTILISRYSPKPNTFASLTNSKIIIEPSWKLQKDLFIDLSTLDMYERMAEIIKSMVYDLRYHLRTG